MSGSCSGGMSEFWRWAHRVGLVRTLEPPWEGCCEEHDKFYAKGGTSLERRIVDNLLRECVLEHGYPGWAYIMWLAVRVGGWPFWPTSFRWGFDRPYGTGYNTPEYEDGA